MSKFFISKSEKLANPDQNGNYWFGQPGGECLAILISLGERYRNVTKVTHSDRYFVSLPTSEGVIFSPESPKNLLLFDTPQMAFAWVRAKYGVQVQSKGVK